MRIFLVRHGESESNAKPSVSRSKPNHEVPLTDKGVDQMRQCAKFLKNYIEKNPTKPSFNISQDEKVNKMVENVFNNFANLMPQSNGNIKDVYKAKMWISPFARTRDSAAIINSECSSFIGDKEESLLIVEQLFGILDGLNEEDKKKSFFDIFSKFKNQQEKQGEFWVRPDGGESPYDVSLRASNFYSKLVEAQRENFFDQIVVSHAFFQKVFVSSLCKNKRYEDFYNIKTPENASIRLIENLEDKGIIFKS